MFLYKDSCMNGTGQRTREGKAESGWAGELGHPCGASLCSLAPSFKSKALRSSMPTLWGETGWRGRSQGSGQCSEGLLVTESQL